MTREKDESGILCQRLTQFDVNELSDSAIRVPEPAVHERLECCVDAWRMGDSSSEELRCRIDHSICGSNDSSTCSTNNLQAVSSAKDRAGQSHLTECFCHCCDWIWTALTSSIRIVINPIEPQI
jgi:hypothetical protein